MVTACTHSNMSLKFFLGGGGGGFSLPSPHLLTPLDLCVHAATDDGRKHSRLRGGSEYWVGA